MLLEVGRITKAHGLKGEVVVYLSTDRDERVAAGSILSSDNGELEVVSSRRHQDRWIVAFAGVADRNGAEALRNTVLRAEPIDDENTLWVHELIGAEVVDTSGRSHGPVLSVEANPASDLLVLEGDRLVPLTFVTGRGEAGEIIVDPPPGLLD